MKIIKIIHHIRAARHILNSTVPEPIRVGSVYRPNPRMEQDCLDYQQHLWSVPSWLRWLCK